MLVDPKLPLYLYVLLGKIVLSSYNQDNYNIKMVSTCFNSYMREVWKSHKVTLDNNKNQNFDKIILTLDQKGIQMLKSKLDNQTVPSYLGTQMT